VKSYFVGDTAVEAYLKSVQWLAQGVFMGGPSRDRSAQKLGSTTGC
jgi:hypothetical protein